MPAAGMKGKEVGGAFAGYGRSAAMFITSDDSFMQVLSWFFQC